MLSASLNKVFPFLSSFVRNANIISNEKLFGPNDPVTYWSDIGQVTNRAPKDGFSRTPTGPRAARENVIGGLRGNSQICNSS